MPALVRFENAEGVGELDGAACQHWFGLKTPKALANFQPSGWSEATTLGNGKALTSNPAKGSSLKANAFSVDYPFLISYPGLSLRSNRWAEIGQRLRRLNPSSLCQQIVRIPMVGGTGSLNLSVAGSLLLYAVFRSAVRTYD